MMYGDSGCCLLLNCYITSRYIIDFIIFLPGRWLDDVLPTRGGEDALNNCSVDNSDVDCIIVDCVDVPLVINDELKIWFEGFNLKNVKTLSEFALYSQRWFYWLQRSLRNQAHCKQELIWHTYYRFQKYTKDSRIYVFRKNIELSHRQVSSKLVEPMAK